MPHKFKVGDIVAINPAISRFVPGGVFEVVKQLPGVRPWWWTASRGVFDRLLGVAILVLRARN